VLWAILDSGLRLILALVAMGGAYVSLSSADEL
jgi:hypothetical protein